MGKTRHLVKVVSLDAYRKEREEAERAVERDVVYQRWLKALTRDLARYEAGEEDDTFKF